MAARADLLPVFALTGDPKRAHDFLKPLSGDHAADDATMRMLDRLRGYYLGAGRRAELVALDLDLGARRGPSGRCERQLEIVEVTGLGLPTAKDAVVGSALRLVEVAAQLAASHDPDAATCSAGTISLLTALAMEWDAEAVGLVGARPAPAIPRPAPSPPSSTGSWPMASLTPTSPPRRSPGWPPPIARAARPSRRAPPISPATDRQVPARRRAQLT